MRGTRINKEQKLLRLPTAIIDDAIFQITRGQAAITHTTSNLRLPTSVVSMRFPFHATILLLWAMFFLLVTRRVSRGSHVFAFKPAMNNLGRIGSSSNNRASIVCLFSSSSKTDGSQNRLSSRRLHSEQRTPVVPIEISPADHGTKPLESLVSPSFDNRLVEALENQAFTTPTPIQSAAIPLLSKGLDVLASAQTGSGKTLMFSLPLCNRLLLQQVPPQTQKHGNRDVAHPRALVLSPTRELAMQTARVLQDLVGRRKASSSPLKVTLAIGGESVTKQRQELRRDGCDILVGTPGRVLQFVDERTTLDLASAKEVVIDEADRMLDLGFEPQLKRISRALGGGRFQKKQGEDRHTVLCSATFPPEVQRVASEFLKQDYYFVAAGRVGATHDSIVQNLLWVDSNTRNRRNNNNNNGGPPATAERTKRKLILDEIKKHRNQYYNNKAKNGNDVHRTIIFSNTKEEAERLGEYIVQESRQLPRLTGGGKAIRVVHGDKSQAERNKSLEAFRNGQTQVLIATDVAARGLDVSGIGLVVQASAPRDIDTFVHRVGRTGRAGARGHATTILDGRSLGIASGLVQLMEETNQNVPAWLRGMAHVSRARLLEEEGAIAAGGGGSEYLASLSSDNKKPDGTASSNNNTSGDEEEGQQRYSEQDFRRDAVAGSWGSERDTSYHSFDEEAYSSLDDNSFLGDASNHAFLDEEEQAEGLEEEEEEEEFTLNENEGNHSRDVWAEGDKQDSKTHALDEIEDTDGDLDGDSDTVDTLSLSSLSSKTAKSSNDTMPKDPRQQQNAMPEQSKELRSALKSITDEKTAAVNKPDEKVLRALSRAGSQKLRFEYIGLFPFDEIRGLLVSRGTNGHENRGNEASGGGVLPRVLMVAEKPSIAKAIADALTGPNGPRQRRGISRALPVYEFTSNAFLPIQEEEEDTIDATTTTDGGRGRNSKKQRCLVTVTSVVGHVFSLGFVEQQNTGGGDGSSSPSYTDPSEYFRIPVVKKEETSTGKLRVVDHLRALAADCDYLVLWLDCDAEGENIAHEVIGVTRRALDLKAAAASAAQQQQREQQQPIRRIYRARFSAITGEALRDAFGNLMEPDAALSRSVDARQELDLRVGVAFTRLLSWRGVGLARKHFSPATKVLSYGPCQSPALSLCVDRAKEIEAFRPVDYWKLSIATKLPGSNAKEDLRWRVPSEDVVKNNRGTEDVEENATFNETAAEDVVKLALSPESALTVTKVECIPERMNPPLGLNTVALLTAGSKAMGMSPKQVMNVAEKLYSAGFISYPRTESTKYDPQGFDVRSMLRQHTSHPEWGKTASYLLRTKYSKFNRPPQRGHDAGDHPPITSLKAATRDEVGGGQAWRVYEFVTRNFLGSLGDELEFTRSVAELEIRDGKGRRTTKSFNDDDDDRRPRFELEQVTIDSLGFAGACRWVLRDVGANSKDAPRASFQEGMTLPVASARVERCSTRPPRFLQEHDLIQLMDKNRIGTDASMATHVTNIVNREYVVLCDETGAPIRPPRPPRPGQKPLPRQVGRYMVPTSLGIGVLDLFGEASTAEETTQTKNDGLGFLPNCEENSPVSLTRPAIRAQMEAEVKQIALGKLDKSECLEKNLAWFEGQYDRLFSSLTRQRVGSFARSLSPVRDNLRYWRRLGAFETESRNASPQQQQQQQQNNKKQRRNRSSTGRKPNPKSATKGARKGTRKGPARKRKGMPRERRTVP